MRNIFKISFCSFLFVGLVTTSCSDATDITQKGEATEEIVYQTVDDLQLGLNGVYRVYDPGANDNGNGDAILFNDLFTDNIKTGSSYGGHGIQMYQFNLQASSYTPESIWANRYVTINYANRVLRAADNIESTLDLSASEIVQFNHIKGQLLAWRAIAHYDIFMYFTPDYQSSSSLSAIIMDYVPEILDKPVRNTAGEVVEFIFNDLNTASDLIATGGNDPFFINIDVINAFKARLALATGDYATAGQLAGDLLTKYTVADRLSYIALFEDLDLNSSELIFGLLRVRDDSEVAGSWYSNATNINGSPLFEMSKQLYDLYGVGDVRIDEVLLDATSEPENDIYLIDKYPGSEELLLNNLKIVRSSEMAFILAEVQARSSDFVGAAETLEMVTDARYSGPGSSPAISFSSLNEALNRILLERRKELCFEGHRYLDLKRIGREISVGIDRYASDAATFSSAAPTSLPSNDYRFTLPIPQAEINGNRNVEQNPTYTNN